MAKNFTEEDLRGLYQVVFDQKIHLNVFVDRLNDLVITRENADAAGRELNQQHGRTEVLKLESAWTPNFYGPKGIENEIMIELKRLRRKMNEVIDVVNTRS